jgi:hypothetical protein
MEVIPAHLREFGSGLEVTNRNLLGFAMGPMLPGIFMSVIGSAFSMDRFGKEPVDPSWPEDQQKQFLEDQNCLAETAGARKLYYGFAFIMGANVLMLLFFWRAVTASSATLEENRRLALKHLQEAIGIEAGRDVEQKEKKLHQIDKAIAEAKKAELQTTDGGEGVMGAANENRGELQGEIDKARGRAKRLEERERAATMKAVDTEATEHGRNAWRALLMQKDQELQLLLVENDRLMVEAENNGSRVLELDEEIEGLRKRIEATRQVMVSI